MIFVNRSICLSILFAFCKSLIFCQQFEVRDVGIQYNLESTTINHLMKDSRGDTWLAAQELGLIRISGSALNIYGKKQGLIGNDATYLLEDKKGNIWVATSEGISKFDGQHFENFSSNGLQNVYCIITLKDGNLLAATRGAGIFKYNGKIWQPWKSSSQLPSQNVFCLTVSQDNLIYVGMEGNGVGYFKDKKFYPLKLPKGLISNTVFCSYIAKDGKIWFGTSRGQVLYENKENVTLLKMPASIGTDFIGGITGDNEGKVWIATEHGIVITDGISSKIISKEDGLSSNAVNCLANDKNGNIWVGTNGSGINVCNKRFFYRFSLNNGAVTEGVSCVGASNLNSIFVGSIGNGLYQFDSENIHPSNINELKDVNITNIFRSSKGDFWVGTRSSGVFCFSFIKNKFNLKSKINQVNNVDIISPICFSEDENKNVWAACYGSGLLKIDSLGKASLWSTSSIDQKIPSDNVICILNKKDKTTWFSTIDSGLFYLKENKLISYKNGLFKTQQGIWTFAEDNQNRLIVSTREFGLVIISNNKIVIPQNASINKNVKAIYVNNISNEIWTAGETGVFVFQLNSSNQLILKQQFSSQEGLTRFGPQENGFYGKGNDLWLASNAGLLRFDLNLNKQKVALPSVKLNQVLLFNKETDWKKYSNAINQWTNLPTSAEFPYNKNQLLFRFSTLSINQEWQYEYKLEGLEESWSLPTLNKEVLYSALKPGKYTFKVRVWSAKGISGPESSFSFTILTPFWETWWFLVSLMIAVIATISIIINWQIKRLKLEQEKKEIINKKIATAQINALHSQMNPHFIFNALNGIHRFIWDNKPEKASEYLTKFAKVIRLVLEYSRKQWLTLDEDVKMLNDYLELQALSLSQGLNFSITIEDSLDSENVVIPPLLLQPFIENSIIHGLRGKEGIGNISIYITHNEKELICKIEDDGIGRKISKSATGLEKNHKSLSTLITAERLEVVNILYGGNPRFEYFDKKDALGNPTGTLVTLYLPYLTD
jgi:ligand-binding sensor domain-containing protein